MTVVFRRCELANDVVAAAAGIGRPQAAAVVSPGHVPSMGLG
jgi:hypothetical protein